MRAIAAARNKAAIEAATKKQLDIVADCGVKGDVLEFFRKQPIKVTPQQTSGHDNGGGSFTQAGGVQINPDPRPTERPIVLHELLHAFHAHYLPRGVDNPDVIQFYTNAVRGELYPRTEYLMSNKAEFFAVTASVYLAGFVARIPNNRETLRARQPVYYKWLGELFGVAK